MSAVTDRIFNAVSELFDDGGRGEKNVPTEGQARRGYFQVIITVNFVDMISDRASITAV